MIQLEEHEFIASSGRAIFYLCAGSRDGPLMIFCHGWPAIAMTWKCQLEAFANLGFRVVAPDMPGYGKSTVSKDTSDYSLEMVNRCMKELLDHCGREQAVWVGHDWGAVAVWSFAAHYPEQTKAAVGLARPCHTLELGLEEVLKSINREVFPVEQYPYGQYDYQVYFESCFERASEWFDQDIEGVLRAIYAKGRPEEVGKPGVTASVTKDGGWFGGAASPPPQLRDIPFQAMCVDETMFNCIVGAMKKNGFRSANAWYCNNQRNRAYFLEESKHGGHLKMPVLFVGASWDPISDITVSTIAHAQRHFCDNLTEVKIDAGHWMALERPFEVNAAIARWLVQSVPEIWPVH